MTRGPAGDILAHVAELDLLRAEETGAEAPEGTPPGDGEGHDQGEAGGGPAASAGEPSAAQGLGPGDALDDEELMQRAAALLFASPDPLSTERLTHLLERPAKARVRAVLASLAERLTAAGLPIALNEIAGGWRLFTRPDMADVVQRLAKVQRVEKVTPAALETLAIVAYRQPVTSAEVEAIRGVQSGAMLRALVDKGLVRVTGRADQPGAPLQYGTTREFLDRFGLPSLKDLPRDGELARS